MDNNMPLISIIIATFNSENVLPLVLKSILNQSYPRDKIELLVVDGGSKDSTLEIAKRYNCISLNNPKTEPVNAKLIGLRAAKGKYVITIDHDEVVENRDSILRKVKTLQSHSECKVALCSGYKRPQSYPMLNQYISDFGDPFSLFIYSFPKGYVFFESAIRHKFKVESYSDYLVITFDLMKEIIMELFCLGTMIDAEYFKNKFPDCQTDGYILTNLFYLMLKEGDTKVVLLQNDPLIHYSVDSLKAYFPKLKWRIYNNVFFLEKGAAGFNGRMEFQEKIKLKKYLFIPYSFSVIIPFLHGLGYSLSRRNSIYLIHPILCIYVSVTILTAFVKHALGLKVKLLSYDGKKEIEE